MEHGVRMSCPLSDCKFAHAMEEKGKRKLLGADVARTKLCCGEGLGEEA